MAPSDLRGQARLFAGTLRDLLNRTVCDGARVGAEADKDRRLFTVSTDPTGFESRAVPLRSSSSTVRCWLDLQTSVYLEDKTGYLTTRASYFGITDGPDSRDPIFHYDYERNKDGYTEAHVQVFGANDQLTPIMAELSSARKKKTMGELHFPVGGRRFRPALEDVLEFLIDEQLVDPHPGWEAVIEGTRRRFRDIQLRAAVRHNQVMAASALEDQGWTVTRPPAKA